MPVAVEAAYGARRLLTRHYLVVLYTRGNV